MTEHSINPSVAILKAVATYFSSVATAIASFVCITIIVAAAGGKNVVNLRGNEVFVSFSFIVLAFLVSIAILGLSCFVLSLLPMVTSNESN